jgi:peptide/nickel transport system permease protein
MALLSWGFPQLGPTLNLGSAELAPGLNHIMGTDALGRDVARSLVAGAQRSLMVSILAGLAGSVLGVVLGSIPAFFGDDRLKLSLAATFTIGFGLLLLLYCTFLVWPLAVYRTDLLAGVGIPALGLLALFSLNRGLRKVALFRKTISAPVDLLVLRFTEVFTVVPRLYFILAFAMVMRINLLTIVILFALTGWATISRLTRAEMLKVRAMPYIEAARLIGQTEWRVFMRHALPNAVGPLATQVCFTMASILVMEATLSFVGVGVSAELISWGSILHGYTDDLTAWWLVVFPGTVIYLTVLSFHALGQDLDLLFHSQGNN